MNKKPDDEAATPVLFRVDKELPLEVTAVFPTIPGSTNNITCYAHIGQHGDCSLSWYHGTRAAKPWQYVDLKRELESAPYHYRLKVYQRMQPWHFKARWEAERQEEQNHENETTETDDAA